MGHRLAGYRFSFNLLMDRVAQGCKTVAM